MLRSQQLSTVVRGDLQTKRVLFDVALAFVLAFGLNIFQPGAAQSAGGDADGSGGPTLPTTEGDGDEPKECECETQESRTALQFTVTCVNSAGTSLGGIPIGAIGWAGAALTNLTDQYLDWSTDEQIEQFKAFKLDRVVSIKGAGQEWVV